MATGAGYHPIIGNRRGADMRYTCSGYDMLSNEVFGRRLEKPSLLRGSGPDAGDAQGCKPTSEHPDSSLSVPPGVLQCNMWVSTIPLRAFSAY